MLYLSIKYMFGRFRALAILLQPSRQNFRTVLIYIAILAILYSIFDQGCSVARCQNGFCENADRIVVFVLLPLGTYIAEKLRPITHHIRGVTRRADQSPAQFVIAPNRSELAARRTTSEANESLYDAKRCIRTSTGLRLHRCTSFLGSGVR